jgi:hypothetical protein
MKKRGFEFDGRGGMRWAIRRFFVFQNVQTGFTDQGFHRTGFRTAAAQSRQRIGHDQRCLSGDNVLEARRLGLCGFGNVDEKPQNRGSAG